MKRLPQMFLAATILVATLGAGAASANPRTPRIDRREARQHARIAQGIHCGRLTRGEALRLRAGQRRIQRMEWRAKRDGRVSMRERYRMNRALDRESARIFWLKHNRRGARV